MRQKILLVAAVAFGLLAAYLTYSQLQKERMKLLARTQRVELIAISRDIAKGEMITDDVLEKKIVVRFRSQMNSDEILWKNKDQVG